MDNLFFHVLILFEGVFLLITHDEMLEIQKKKEKVKDTAFYILLLSGVDGRS